MKSIAEVENFRNEVIDLMKKYGFINLSFRLGGPCADGCCYNEEYIELSDGRFSYMLDEIDLNEI